MLDRRETGQVGCSTAGMQERWDARQVGCKTGGMQTGGMRDWKGLDWRDA